MLIISGADVGGSIRIPSFFCGIFGHKPTRKIVSNYEQQPVAETVLQNFLVTGPMSRFCADLLPMYRILAAENVSKLKLDTKVLSLIVVYHSSIGTEKCFHDEQVSVSKLRYFYLENFGRAPLISRVHPDMKEAQMKVVRHIQQAYNIPVQKVYTFAKPFLNTKFNFLYRLI